ncbi:MAG: purine-binding chemotaxis protein CheW [Xanthomonadaceae bacterium]|nr:purine-binding chemotaxis protein CheW [Xanthomonadaceae bacterium]
MAKRGKQKSKGKTTAVAASPVAGHGDGSVVQDAEAAVDEAAPSAEVQAPASEDAFDAASASEVPVDAAEPEPVDIADDAPLAEVSAAEPVAGKPAKRSRRTPAGPREQRAPFLVLADYEQRSLAHVAGLPEQLDAPGLWRGVAYRVGAHRLASGFDEVIEILPLPALTHVPGSQPWMLGVANIRGTLLPVVDLKQFLEGERTVLHERQRILVMRQPGGDVAITIDELYGQRSFVDAQGISADAVNEGRYEHFIDRAYRMNDQDWGVFSFERLARTPEFRQAAA